MRYVLRGEYQPGTNIRLRKGRAVALLLVHDLHLSNKRGVVTEEQILAKFTSNIDTLKEAGNKDEVPAWVRFLLRHSKKDGKWYRKV